MLVSGEQQSDSVLHIPISPPSWEIWLIFGRIDTFNVDEVQCIHLFFMNNAVGVISEILLPNPQFSPPF